MSVTAVRVNAMCLLERLSQLDPGAGAAAKRQAGALQLEERRRRDRPGMEREGPFQSWTCFCNLIIAVELICDQYLTILKTMHFISIP